MTSNGPLWLIWLLATSAAAAVMIAGLLYGGSARPSLVIGRMTDGHHQIELACTACHTTAFGGKESIQKACVGCHGAELATAKDTHPAKKFADPRNADRLEKLEATQCVTCHTEHRGEITTAMGLTLPPDFCALCHQDIGKDRPSHEGLAFATCTSAGCHNYHDNRALYEDFLERHAKDPETASKPIVKLRASPPEKSTDAKPIVELAAADAPAGKSGDAAVAADWLASAHAKGGVNCSGCHAPGVKSKEEYATRWIDKPDHTVCATCHKDETATFSAGRHGMRLAPGLMSAVDGPLGLTRKQPLTPMRPELARLPMSAKAHGTDLTCTTCHGAHAFDTARAEVEACLGCHDDKHSRAYVGSPHETLAKAERDGAGVKGTGVTCATCHMPRTTREDPDTGEEHLLVVHNQNDNLRPNEKMLRSVCMNCHGLGFAIDALADTDLVSRNFAGRPSARVESIEWVMRRLKEREGKSAGSAGSK